MSTPEAILWALFIVLVAGAVASLWWTPWMSFILLAGSWCVSRMLKREEDRARSDDLVGC